jgi:hypothetical protein
LNSDLPYIQAFDNSEITAVPFSLEVIALAHATRFGNTPNQYVEIFDYFLKQSLAIGDLYMPGDIYFGQALGSSCRHSNSSTLRMSGCRHRSADDAYE